MVPLQSGLVALNLSGRPSSVAFAAIVMVTSLRRTQSTEAANDCPAGIIISSHVGSRFRDLNSILGSYASPETPVLFFFYFLT